ncbi:hypothetical protein, partial [Streptomyces chiangmaiensis]
MSAGLAAGAGFEAEVEVGEVGAACGADGVSGEVVIDAVEVDRGAEDGGEAGFGMASVAAAADASG